MSDLPMLESMSALLVEGDARLAQITAKYLANYVVEVTHLSDGEAALAAVSRTRYDVVILEVALPKRDGLSVCRMIRKASDVPIVFLSARVDEADRVLGLEAGADDYIMKPFSPRELLARMRAVVRRYRGSLVPRTSVFQVGSLVMNEATYSVTMAGRPVALTSAEFDLLRVLARSPGRIFTREQLLGLARRSDDDVFDRTIDGQISRIRSKLTSASDGAAPIRTIRGLGYMLSGYRC
jgi:DNA-binding response OmpR family regulator